MNQIDLNNLKYKIFLGITENGMFEYAIEGEET